MARIKMDDSSVLSSIFSRFHPWLFLDLVKPALECGVEFVACVCKSVFTRSDILTLVEAPSVAATWPYVHFSRHVVVNQLVVVS